MENKKLNPDKIFGLIGSLFIIFTGSISGWMMFKIYGDIYFQILGAAFIVIAILTAYHQIKTNLTVRDVLHILINSIVIYVVGGIGRMFYELSAAFGYLLMGAAAVTFVHILVLFFRIGNRSPRAYGQENPAK